jgi:hypothetical protein
MLNSQLDYLNKIILSFLLHHTCSDSSFRSIGCSFDFTHDVTLTESDAAIMLEESAMKVIGGMLIRKKRQGDNDTTAQPTSKQRWHNKDGTTKSAMR